MNRQHLENLILGHFDSALSSEQESELARLLEDSADARDLFASYMRLEGATLDLGIADAIKSCASETVAVSQTQTRNGRNEALSQKFRMNSIGWMAGIAITLVIAFLLIFVRTSENKTAKTMPAVARIVRLVNVDWQGEDGYDIGNDLTPGNYNIASGLAEIEFNNGASIIVEGPSEFEIASSERAFLRHGRIRSIVPPQAFGFTIESKNMKVIDLGTEFGMEVDPDGTSEVHVFDGEVEIYETHPTTIMANRLLSAGQAVQVENVGIQRDIPADIDAFIDPRSLDERASSFVDEMETRLKEIQSEQRIVLRKIRERQRSVKQAKQLKQLKAKAAKSWVKFESSLEQDAEYQQLRSHKDQADHAVDKLIRAKLAATPRGKKLLDKLAAVDADNAAQKKLVAEGRKKRDPKPKHVRELRRIQKLRRNLKKQYRKERNKIEKANPEVREAMSKLKAAKKQMAKRFANSSLSKQKKNAERNRKQFLTVQNRLLSKDPQLVELRDKMSLLTSDAQMVRRRIRQARKWPSTKFVRDADFLQDDLSL